MRKWFLDNGIDCPEHLLKPEVYNFVKANKPPKDYITDKLIKARGHTVLRLPLYLCDLNPIKNIW